MPEGGLNTNVASILNVYFMQHHFPYVNIRGWQMALRKPQVLETFHLILKSQNTF